MYLQEASIIQIVWLQWVRTILSQNTDYFKALNFYKSEYMFCFYLGFHGESVSYSSGLVSLVKGHGQTVKTLGRRRTEFEMRQSSKKGIILIRNPFEAIFSYRSLTFNDFFGESTDASIFFGEGIIKFNIVKLQFRYSITTFFKLRESNIIFISDWNTFVRTSIQSWKDFYLKWIMKGEDILIIYYEDLKDPVKLKYNLINIGNFLEKTNKMQIDTERLKCVLNHPDGKFRRKTPCFTKPKNINTSFIYSNHQKVFINKAIKQVNEEIRKRGIEYPALPSYEDTNIKLTYCSCKK